MLLILVFLPNIFVYIKIYLRKGRNMQKRGILQNAANAADIKSVGLFGCFDD
jgi:hypothetical protein